MTTKRMVFIVLTVILLTRATARAEIVAKDVPYTHNGTNLKGFMVYDDAFSGRRPGILVVHEWWGLNDYARRRAEQLAKLGYVAFALDMYGEHKLTQHPDQASAWMKEITRNVAFWQGRAMAGLEILKKNPEVDPSRLGAIGYCFGGSTVQQLAYGGADLQGVVSFHGSLIPPPFSGINRVKARILICHGSSDPFVTGDALRNYLAAMESTPLDWQMIIYGGARHGFTNPGADKFGMEGLQYNAKADHRSWDHMQLFFEEIFGNR
jgi:dienelactone hydrolase